jgi:primosomal protein N' (replication factor Y)
MFVSVAVNIPSEKTFSYSVPETLRKEISIGKRVLIPFGKRRLTGYIVEVLNFAPCEDIKEIIEILDPEPLFNETDLKFYRWASQYYLYSPGKALSEILPGGIDPQSDQWITLAQEGQERSASRMSASQRSIIDALTQFPDGFSLTQLKKMLGKKDIYRDINALQSAGAVTVENRTRKPHISKKKGKIITLNLRNQTAQKPTKKQRLLIDLLTAHGPLPMAALRAQFKDVLSIIKTLELRGVVCVTEEEVSRHHDQSPDLGIHGQPITPNDDQEFALHEIAKGLESGRFSPYLLHGVTGSGKTEVYLKAVEKTLGMNGGVIFLVPEIALTPQLISRFNNRFPDQEKAILHSGISRAARYDQWRRIQRGEISVVIGARSAVFAPVRDLKLIIVDEEHDTSYKQDDRMRYNARDLAIMRAKLNSATVITGSATPAIQTYFNTMKGKYIYLILPKRVEDRPLPEVEIIDMKRELGGNDRIASPVLSKALHKAIEHTLEKKQQTILFLNRRGFHTFIFCLDCGHAFQCQNCAVSLTYHAEEDSLKCHYCDFVMKPPQLCPGCRGNRIRSYGVGTERLAEEVKKLFPEARIERMDSDTTTGKGAYENILRALNKRAIDIIVGTQMITKGHDFPGVTLVGVISADTSLNVPDFRAAERTFQLLTQVSGRGGRGAFPGKVIIQTFNPYHYAITRARDHDYLGFFEDELALRSTLAYPPFSRMINLHLSSLKKEKDMGGLDKLKQLIRDLSAVRTLQGKVEVIGPAESPIARIKGRHRWQVLLKGKDTRAMHKLAEEILAKASVTGWDIRADVDPLNFM